MTSHDGSRRQHHDARAREARQRIATEAARLITEQAIGDHAFAVRKAAARLGVSDPAAMPRADEIDEALREYQRLFRHETQPRALRERREAAVEAMRFFGGYDARLVGPVLDGSADEHSPVTLHLFSDEPTAIADFLGTRRIPYELDARRLRLSREREAEFPRYRFDADGIGIELIVMPRDALRTAPIGRDDKPIDRANAARVLMLLRGVA